MGLYNKDDLVTISYQQFGQTMDALLKKITDYQSDSNVKFDLIVPLLRSGAFPAFHIAARLEIKNILPVYYMYEKGVIVKKMETPSIHANISSNPNILICDSCLTSGKTLQTALADLIKIYPTANFYAAIVWLEEGIDSIPGVKRLFWGLRTNEHKSSDNRDCINGLVVAPWEDIEVDWKEIKDY